MSLALINGEVFINGKLEKANVLCANEKIEKITTENITADRIIDISGKILLPGAIDCHVHFREPGQEYKEDFLSGSSAAAAGGVTTIFAMPNTNPAIIDCETLKQEKKLAEKSVVNWGCYIGASDDNSEEIKKATNIPGVKIYLDVTTGNLKIEGEDLLQNIFQSHKRIAVHAEGEKVRECIARIKKTNHTLYLCHVSSKEEIEMIREGKTDQVFCEVTPHHLFFTKEEEERKGSYASMKPELKLREDVDALWEGISDGTVDTVCTDHAPHTREEKESENPPWGVPGVQTMLPLMLNAVNEKRLSLKRLVELVSENPAKIFSMSKKGRIKEGLDADLVVVDMQLEKPVRNEDQLSKCGWTPWDKKVLKGWPIITIVNGNIVFDKETVDINIKGKEVRFN